MAIIAGGKIPFAGPVDVARDRIRPQVRLETRDRDGPWRAALPGDARREGALWYFSLPDTGIEPLLRALIEGNAGILSLSIERAGLHDAFVAIAGEGGGAGAGTQSRRGTAGMTGRLSTFAAAFVVARRDFGAILFSRSFFFFLLGPLFPVLVAVMAGGVGQRVQQSAERPELGIAMEARDVDAMLSARETLAPKLGSAVPALVVIEKLEPDANFDAQAALAARRGNIAAILIGTPSTPKLIGTADRIAQWQGPVSMLAAQALVMRRQPIPMSRWRVPRPVTFRSAMIVW